MTISVEAIYEGGVLRPLRPLDLAEGTKAVLLVEPITAKLEVMREAMNDPLFLADLKEVAEDFKPWKSAFNKPDLSSSGF